MQKLITIAGAFLGHFALYNVAVLFWPASILLKRLKAVSVFRISALVQAVLSLVAFGLLGYRWFILKAGVITEMILPFMIGLLFMAVNIGLAIFLAARSFAAKRRELAASGISNIY